VPGSLRLAGQRPDRRASLAGYPADQPGELHLAVLTDHHHVVIHRMGLTLVRHPDGTTMAWNRDKSKDLRSHSPPARAG
jgi:hypothetical protein